MASSKGASKENQQAVRKSILRNPEVPLQNQQKSVKRISIVDQKDKAAPTKAKETKSLSLHEPKINQLAEWRKTLAEINNFNVKEVKEMQDVSKNTQDFINRAVSQKLNFPAREQVFKNLPKIDEDEGDSVPRNIPKVNIPKKLDSKREIQKLLNDLVSAEYQNEELNKKVNIAQSYTDEWLDINKKFKGPSFLLPKQKTETQVYNEQLREDLYNHLFACESYISGQIKFDPEKTVNNTKKAKDCKCMSEFYSKHSMCS